MQKARWFVALSLVYAAACDCGRVNTGKLAPELKVEPLALSFAACPNVDDQGQPVPDILADQEFFRVQNVGRVSGPVLLQLDGPDKDLFSLVDAAIPKDLAPNADAQIPVLFSPKAATAYVANLLVDDGNPDTAVETINLVGEGIQRPAQPTLRAWFESPGAEDISCFEEASVCLVNFPDTFRGLTTNLKLKIRNEGCPKLNVTDIAVLPEGDIPMAFSVLEPTALPSLATPVSLDASGGRDEFVLSVNFSPIHDNDENTQRYAHLRLKTNDPKLPEFEFLLSGNAIQPSLSVSPTGCNFGSTEDPCGNSPKISNQARFTLTNTGTAAFTVSKVEFEHGGSGGRFKVTEDPSGTMISPGQAGASLVVTHTDEPFFAIDQLKIVGSAEAGSVVVTLAGGTPPALSTEPEQQLDFKGSLDIVSKKQVIIKNKAGAGTLILNRVYVDASPFYSLLTPVPAGTKIEAGGMLAVEVQYKRPLSGGTQIGALHIDSNDPSYSEPQHKLITLYSDVPLDQVPTAVLKGCFASALGTDPNCLSGRETTWNIRIADLTAAGNKITLSGKASYDPQNGGGQTDVSQYEFRLIKRPQGSTATVQNDAQKTTEFLSDLNFGTPVIGEHKAILRVYDSVGQVSPTYATLTIFIVN